jgi:N4-gp56 family major capsid protein
MGYSPASILTSGNLPQLQAIKYEREAIANLKATTPALSMTKKKPLGLRQGNQVQFFTYALLGANTNQTAEGTVGSPISESTTKILATIGQYADFINTSDLAMDVSIEDPGLIQNLANELNYRLALTLNSLTLLTFQAATAIDANVLITLANGSYLTANNIRSSVQSLAASNVRPLVDEMFGGLMHPFVVKDVLNDTSYNGLTDILKRGDSSDRAKLFEIPKNDEVIEFAGARFKQTTTVPTVTLSGNTFYQTFVVGDDAQFSIFLGPNGDGDKNYKLNIQVAPENGSVSDPARVIGGWCSYNTRFTNTLPPGSQQRLRILQSETSAS